MDLVDLVYNLAERFPDRERFGMWSQITRAATSVPSNIAEGHARSTRKDFAHFVSNARASLMEIDTQLAIAERRAYVTEGQALDAYARIEEISKMLVSLHRKLAPRREAE